ncbi:MAG: hypothetical protein J0L72_00425 [Armatimonadetes bacterium]|nr:hypothetical protein [Armatimonadota bacterium]
MVEIFGIRHHGPGSAKKLFAALCKSHWDAILIEGPSDSSSAIVPEIALHAKPPVAILQYLEEEPEVASFAPFTEYSPEWKAMIYACQIGTPVRFIDLPFGISCQKSAKERGLNSADPLAMIAQESGEISGEVWWDKYVERAGSDEGHFSAISEIMGHIRQETDQLELDIRERWMCHEIAKTMKSGAKRIAVICGAWHAPALERWESSELPELPEPKKTISTWVPWSNARLHVQSGYGAGLRSPAFYELVNSVPDSDKRTAIWVSRGSHLLRESGRPSGPSQSVEAALLANSLSNLRGLAEPGLAELEEAILAVCCHGNRQDYAAIETQLLVGERVGQLPPCGFRQPLQIEFQATAKRLRIKVDSSQSDLLLDNREPRDQEKSLFLSRTVALGLGWARLQDGRRGDGNFHELWELMWHPETEIGLISAGRFGATIESASTAILIDRARSSESMSAVCECLLLALRAELSRAIDPITDVVKSLAAQSSSLEDWLRIVPPLCRVLMYGRLSPQNHESTQKILRGLVDRIHIHLRFGFLGADFEASKHLIEMVNPCLLVVRATKQPELISPLETAIAELVADPSVSPVVRGFATRIADLDQPELVNRMSFEFSPSCPVIDSSQWLGGFLNGSAAILIHRPEIFESVRQFVRDLDGEKFIECSPALVASFADIPPGERESLRAIIFPRGEVAKQNSAPTFTSSILDALLDTEEADT